MSITTIKTGQFYIDGRWVDPGDQPSHRAERREGGSFGIEDFLEVKSVSGFEAT